MKTYITLFSSAGVGCYGFKKEGYECVATNELIERRLEVQKFNSKCKYDTGYICGDITEESIKNRLVQEVKMWEKKEHLKKVDVLIATPPCQGMSVANTKKNDHEITRNSLVVESIKIIKELKPKFFIFENVPAFMKTVCTDTDGKEKPISEAIERNLGTDYCYVSKIINFKQYGACSSRQRTLVIGVSNNYADEISPFELYPKTIPEKTLREVIGDLLPLTEMGETSPDDIYHNFRTYPKHMRSWITDLKEGESAFDNEDDTRKPHQIKDGKLVINQKKNGDKYKRQIWDKAGPCIHTRNDQLASQNTIHPRDDRVFSIRELMRMMTVPDDFKWVKEDISVLNSYSKEQKAAFFRKEEMKIRQSLGEAVPTVIFEEIAKNIRKALEHTPVRNSGVKKIIEEKNIVSTDSLIDFIRTENGKYSAAALSRIAELSNTYRTDRGAFFTNKTLITEMMKEIPCCSDKTVRILEPSVGVGNFIPLILKKFEGKNIILDVCDIDSDSIRVLRELIKRYDIPDNVSVNIINDDFLTHRFTEKYDYIIGNPPFFKMSAKDPMLKIYKNEAVNSKSTNICSFFLDKAVRLGSYVAIVFPKFILNTPEFAESRRYLSEMAVDSIIDFGEKGFSGVLIETVAIHINTAGKPKYTNVFSLPRKIRLKQKQKYIFDSSLPYWIIYRNELFDRVAEKMKFDVFTVFRDRQITNSMYSKNGTVRVLKSRNISDDGKKITDISGYDGYVTEKTAESLAVNNYINKEDVYITPNMTYYPRIMKKPKGVLVNGSVAVLIPKEQLEMTERQLEYYSTEEYRSFYQIARNYQTRSLNVDACSVYFYGVLTGERK